MARCPWLMPVILAAQEIRKMTIRRNPGQIVWEPYVKKTLHTKGLVECLKV
jgi:hypothetical protein